MRRSALLASMLLLLLLQPIRSVANVPDVSLTELFRRADLVVMASVTSISKSSSISPGNAQLMLATITIKKCWKRVPGRFTKNRNAVKILFTTGDVEEVEVTAGEVYFFIIESFEGGPRPIGGVQGVLPVSSGRVGTMYLTGPAERGLGSFEQELAQLAGEADCLYR